MAGYMRILFIGDIVGRAGRDLVKKGLKGLVAEHDVDLVIANAENSAAGFGITREIGDELLKAGVDVMTSGNHIFDKKEALDYIASEPNLLRPGNYPGSAPGRGSTVARTRMGMAVGVINLMGRVHMSPLDDPFALALKEVDALRARAKVIFVDFHAEATSEKMAMGWHLDGRVTAVAGTHTHVQTADERLLPNGTAYITDAGMTGAHDAIIGMDTAASLTRFVTGMPSRFEPATANPRLNGALIDADDQTGLARAIVRVSHSLPELIELAARHA